MKSLHATYPPLNIQASQTLLLQRFGSFLWTTFINWFWLFGNGCAMNEHFGSTVLMLPCRYSNLCFCVAYYSVGGKCLRIWWLPTRVYTVWPMVFLQCQVVVFSSELQGTLQLCRSLYCQHSGVHSVSFFWKLLLKKRRKTKVMWEVNFLLSVSLLIDWSLALNYEPLSGNS